jgi:hypothetical protein
VPTQVVGSLPRAKALALPAALELDLALASTWLMPRS